MKMNNIDGENLLNDWRNFNEIFRKDVTYDDIKSHKKPRLHPLSRRYIFGKTTEEGQINPPSRLRVKLPQINFPSKHNVL